MNQIIFLLRQAGKSPEDIYRDVLSLFKGVPYVWGGSSFEYGSDCSGTVCTALNAAFNRDENPLRVTAHELFIRYFTEISEDSERIGALFFTDKSGKAVHVSGRISSFCYMNMSMAEPSHTGQVRSFNELKKLYPHLTIHYRSLKKDGWK